MCKYVHYTLSITEGYFYADLWHIVVSHAMWVFFRLAKTVETGLSFQFVKQRGVSVACPVCFSRYLYIYRYNFTELDVGQREPRFIV